MKSGEFFLKGIGNEKQVQFQKFMKLIPTLTNLMLIIISTLAYSYSESVAYSEHWNI